MTGGGDPDALLDRLAGEYVARLRGGEAVDAEAYALEHPELAERIRKTFPVLALMEGLKPPRRGTATEPSLAGRAVATPSLPERIGPYLVLRELGRGGMGRVFEGLAPDGRRVALKVVHAHLVDRPGYLARFLREAEAGRRIDHPGLIRTLDAGVQEEGGVEVPYLVLEFVEGQDLRELLRETKTVSERFAREIGRGVAEALAAVHASGLVHRDVKPENVVVAPDERVKLADLGVALVQEEALRLTATGEFVGSFLYAAPEQLDGGPVDGRADLYALGLLLYELVAGCHPGAGGEGRRPARLVPGAGAPSVRRRAPAVSPFFDALVRRLLAADPGDRPRCAAEVASILAEGEGGAWWHAEARRWGGRRRAASTPLPFVGRGEELRVLDAALRSALRGVGQVVLLEGEPGIGKSRLLDAWLEASVGDETDGPRVLLVEHAPGEGAAGGLPLARAIREVLGDRDLEVRLAELLGPRRSAAAELAQRLRGETPRGIEAPLGGEAAGTWLVLLRALAAERPLVVCLEDLHFASEETRRLFVGLAHGTGEHAILLVGTSRPGTGELWNEDLAHREHVRRLALSGLPAAAGHELLRAALDGKDPDPGVAVDLVHRSDGNPFHLLELAREARGASGSARTATPASLKDLVRRRVEALPADGRDLLAAAACAGDPFDPVLVCDAVGLPRLAALRLLHQAHRDHGLLQPEGDGYRFAHHLVQEVLVEELPAPLRRASHTALADAIERRWAAGGGPPGDETEFAVVRHHLLGEAPQRAIPYLPRALESLFGAQEYHRSARLARRALDLGDRLPPALRGRALLALSASLLAWEAPHEVLPHLEEAHRLARASGDEELALRVCTIYGPALRMAGRIDDALALFEEAHARAVELGNVRLEGRLAIELGRSRGASGRDAALEMSRRGLDCARQGGDPFEVTSASIDTGLIALEAGELQEARSLLEGGLAMASLHGWRGQESLALTYLGKLAFVTGDAGMALDLTRRQLALNRESGNLRLEAVSRVNLAHTLSMFGQYTEGLEHAYAALEASRQRTWADIEIHALQAVTILESHQGRLDRALVAADDGTRSARALAAPTVLARLLNTRARLLLWLGDFEAVEAIVAEAASLVAGRQSIRERFAFELLEAELAEARGDEAAARVRYEAHCAELLRLGMVVDLPGIQARLGELRARDGDVDGARAALQEALARAEAAGRLGVAALARAGLAVLPGGDPLAGRVALDQHGGLVPALHRVRALYRLGAASGDRRLCEDARTALEAMRADLPERHREGMLRVPQLREVLASSA